MDFPICYLIMCHNNPKNVKDLIDVLDAKDAYFVIHIDKKCNDDFSFASEYSNVFIIKDRISITWGDITVIDAVLKLSEYALNVVPFARYYCLLSGADFPVKNHDYIKKYLSNGNERDYIQGVAFPSSETQWIEGGRRRLEAYVVPINSHSNATIEPRRFTIENCRQFCKTLIKNPKSFLKAIHIWKSYPKRVFPVNFQPYAGEMWWILTNKTLNNVLSWNRQNPKYHKFHLNSQIPDEMYFNTIVWNISDSTCHDIKRYISWVNKTDMSPRWMIFEQDVKTVENCINNQEILFIRKVKDSRLIGYIRQMLCDVPK